MTNRKNTKRALFSSVLALILCFSMLLGSTYAWFTDSAATAVNTIQSGTLDVALYDEFGTSMEGKTLSFQYKDNQLWEPGATYKLQPVNVVNNGNLALKFKVVVNGLEGDAKLNEVITWRLHKGNDEYYLNGMNDIVVKPGESSGLFYISGHMDENAGNDYQNLTLAGASITILATQASVEQDSFNAEYDANAQYGEAPVVASNSTELAEALSAGKNVVLTKDIKFEAPKANDGKTIITVPADANVTIDLAGHTLDASALTSRPFEVEEGANLIIEAEGANVVPALYGLVKINGTDVDVVVNGGTYEYTSVKGAFIKTVDAATADIILNNVTYTDNGNGWIIDTVGTADVTVNGGTYTSKGVGMRVTNITMNKATLKTDGYGVIVNIGNGKITNSTITTGSLTLSDTPAVGISAGYGAIVHVENTSVTSEYMNFGVLDGSESYDGEIYVNGGTNGGFDKAWFNNNAAGKIVIDGQLIEKP